MAWQRVSKEEYEKWAQANPGQVARVNGQEVKSPYPEAQDLGGIGNLLRTLSTPFRKALAMPESIYSDTIGKGGKFNSIFLTPEEEMKWEEDPYKSGAKGIAGLASFGVPGGAAAGATTTGARIGSAALRGAGAGALGGFGYSDDGNELQSILQGGLTGGVVGGALQGAGELAQGLIKKPGNGQVVNTLEVDEIAALPKKVKKGLRAQAKSAGFLDDGIGESKSIQNFLKSRGLAGKTPAETLENMTQEFYKAQGLKEAGMEEIGSLSKSYIKQIEDQLDEAVKNSGLGATDTNAITRMKKVLERAPRDAKSLDSIAQQWYDISLTKVGDLKASQSGLYKYGAKAIRDALKEVNKGGSYTEGMSILSSILGLEDEGLVAKKAIEAAKQGIDVPLFAGSGFKGADVKVQGVSDIVNRTRANIGAAQEVGGSGILSPGMAQGIQGLSGLGQKGIPAIGALGGQQQAPQEQPMDQGMYPQQQGPQINEMALVQAVLNGQISTTEANFIMDMLGGGADGGQAMPKTDSGRKAMVARDAAVNALDILSQSPEAAGKLQGVENAFYNITGQANTATQYQTILEGLRSQVFNALGGTSLTPTEKKQYEKFLPKITDSAKQAQQKLANLIPMMESLMGAEVGTPESGSALFNMLGLQ